MGAGRASYIVIWKKSSQVYSAASLETAIKTPIPKGCTAEDKRILCSAFLPDEGRLCVYPISDEEIQEKIKEIQIKTQEKSK